FDGSDPAHDACAIVAELENFNPALAARERWLVLNKADLLDEAGIAAAEQTICAALGQTERTYRISALTGAGTARLAADLMSRLEQMAAEAADPEISSSSLPSS
ncbi:MAG: GTPase ObgE, partial [Gammaproteobacteria bacterium]